MTPRRATAILDAACSYLLLDTPWPIFPVNVIAKKPAIRTGRDHAEHATTEVVQLLRWHRAGLLDAIAMPTGIASGVVVIDVDKKHDGESLLAELEAALCTLPRARVARTQSGGLHLYFTHPGKGIRVRTAAGANSPLGRLLGGRPGIDVRGDGGMVILPPSCRYVWIAQSAPAPLPSLWLAAIQGAGDPPPPERTMSGAAHDWLTWSDPTRGKVIREGSRNDTLHRRGVALRFADATETEILDDLLLVNAARCLPPLGERQVAQIAASAARASRRGS